MKQYRFNEDQLHQFISLIRKAKRMDDDDIQDYKKEWAGITEDEVESIFNHVEWIMRLDFDKDRPLWCMTFAQLVEKKLKDKNS